MIHHHHTLEGGEEASQACPHGLEGGAQVGAVAAANPGLDSEVTNSS